METNVHFNRREVLKVAVTVYGVYDDDPDENIVGKAIDAYQREIAMTSFEGELGFSVDQNPTVTRLVDRGARVVMVLSKPLPTY